MIIPSTLTAAIATYCATHPITSGIVINLLSSGVLNTNLSKNQDFDQAMDRCFRKALEKWSVNADIRKFEERKQWQHYEELKVYIQKEEIDSFDRGTLSLIGLWIDEINKDAVCRQIIDQLKIDKILNLSKDHEEMLRLALEEQKTIAKDVLILLQKGVHIGDEYWRSLSVFEGGAKQLPTTIITGGRDNAKHALMTSCYEPSCLVLKAQSRREAMAFAVASIIEDSAILLNQTFIVENEDAYETLLRTKKSGIIITTVSANHALAKDKGFSVVYCVSIQDRPLHSDIKLSELDRDKYVQALVQSGMDDTRLRQLALDTAEDVNILWRILGIITSSPLWESEDSIRTLIPAMLVVQWNEDYPCDKERIAALAGMDYTTYQRKLQALSMIEECPLTKVGNVWRVKSPYAMINKYYGDVSGDDRSALLECIEWVMEDDDPEALKKYESTELQFWTDKRIYSPHIREGVLQGLALVALMEEQMDNKNLNVEGWVREKLKTFGIERYLSHRSNIKWLAEAAPNAILQYIQEDVNNGSEVMDKIFKVKKVTLGLTDTEIYYSELLFCLESMAWDECLLPQVTDVLLKLCTYQNDSNWSNRPINSLIEIYRLYLPQTFVSLAARVEILTCLAKQHPMQVRDLCVRILRSINDSYWNISAHFQWRWMERQKDVKHFNQVNNADIRKVYDLLISLTSWSAEEIKTLLDISTYQQLECLRTDILQQMREHEDKVRGNEEIVDNVRNLIHHHMTCPNAMWSLKEQDLQVYKDLLQFIEFEDVILKNKHYFENIFYNDPELGIDYHDPESQETKTLELRARIIKEVMEARGLDGLWDLVNSVKEPRAVAGGLVFLEVDLHHREIFQRYVDGNLCQEFVRYYFTRLYYKGTPEQYDKYVIELPPMAPEKQAILLYAPDFNRKLADLAENASKPVRDEYWTNVYVWNYAIEDMSLIITRFLENKRYFDLLQILAREDVLNALSNEEKINILYEMWQKGGALEMMREAYQVAKILETIEMPDSQENRSKLVLMEFTMHEHLCHYLENKKNHLWCLVNEEPEVLHQIVELAFKSDDGRPSNTNETQHDMARIACDYLWHFKSTPCMQEDGSVDESKLKSYIQNYIAIAKERNYEKVWPLIVGKILGNLPEGDGYPSDLMCEMVEELNNDTVDGEIECCISNRRSMSIRSPYEGGTIERGHVATLSKYLERTTMRSPRLSRILEREINSYQYMAQREDNEARMNRLMY